MGENVKRTGRELAYQGSILTAGLQASFGLSVSVCPV